MNWKEEIDKELSDLVRRLKVSKSNTLEGLSERTKSAQQLLENAKNIKIVAEAGSQEEVNKYLTNKLQECVKELMNG